jgi:hypothetical protein
MATLYVTEYTKLGVGANGEAAVPQEPPVAEQVLPITGASTQSAPFNAATAFVRLHTDSPCSIEFGVAPVATILTARMAGNQTEYHGIPRGSGIFSVAVISNI